jgi:PAS domain S-box-containing protein
LGGERASHAIEALDADAPRSTLGVPLGLIALSVFVVAIMWAALVYDARRTEDAAIAQATRDAGNLAMAFQEHVRRTVGAVDQLMVAVAAEHEANPDEFRLPDWLDRLPMLKGMALQVSMVDRNGLIRATNHGPDTADDVSHLPPFRHHLEPAAPQPYISVPVIGRSTKQWSIQITRRMTRDGATFDGIVSVAVDPRYFSQFFDSISIGEHGIVSLAGLDGIVRARQGRSTADGRTADIGQDISGTELFRRLKVASAGTYTAHSPLDGIDRIFAYAAVPDYPLVIGIGIGTDDVLADLRREKGMHFAVGVIPTIIIIALTWFLLRETNRRRDSERKRRQDSFRLLFESNPLPMYVHDTATLRLLAVNDAAVAHFGYSREQFAAKRVQDLWPAEDREKNTEVLRHAGDYHNEESRRYLKSDATTFEAAIHARAVMYHGREARFVAVIDMTERRRAEKERDSNRDFLDRVIEAVPVTISVKDARDLRYILLNRAGEKLWGMSRTDVIGKTPRELFGKESADLIEQHDRMLLQTKTPTYVPEHTIHTPTNGPRLVTSRRLPICDRNGEVQYLLGVIEDVTDRKAIEDQLRQSQKMEAVGNLTGGVAHDFNNLLTVIIGNLDLLQRDVAGNPGAEQRIEEVLQASERGAELTRQMLAFSRRQPLQPKAVDLNALVDDTMRLINRTLGEDITVDVRLAADAGGVLIDRHQFETALLNVAINARDAMAGGGTLTVATRRTEFDADDAALHPEVPPGGYACIEITDTGSGMPADVVEHIFEPFFTTKPSGKGTGLGLSMAYGFMKQSGGHITAYSEVGRGTTFRLYFPLQQAASAHAALSVASVPATGGDGEVILAVDDNAQVRATVVMQLKELGYEVREADGPRAALEILNGPAKIDLLFTDVIMPGGMNGKELATQARDRRPSLKVLFTSGFPGTSSTNATFDEDDLLLSKPYRKRDLAQALRNALGVPA